MHDPARADPGWPDAHDSGGSAAEHGQPAATARALPRRCLNCAPLGVDLAGHVRRNDRDTLDAVQNQLVSARAMKVQGRTLLSASG